MHGCSIHKFSKLSGCWVHKLSLSLLDGTGSIDAHMGFPNRALWRASVVGVSSRRGGYFFTGVPTSQDAEVQEHHSRHRNLREAEGSEIRCRNYKVLGHTSIHATGILGRVHHLCTSVSEVASRTAAGRDRPNGMA